MHESFFFLKEKKTFKYVILVG